MLPFVLIWDHTSFGQETFSTRFALGPTTVACNVHVLDTGYVVSGRVSDTIPYFHLRTFVSGFTQNGELSWTKIYGDTLLQFTGRSDVNARLSENLFVIGCEGSEGGIDNTRLVWFNHLGDTLMSKTYISPTYFPEDENSDDWNKATAMCSDSNGNIYFASVIVAEGSSACWIQKTDPYGNQLWHEIIQFGDLNNTCYSLATDDFGIYGGGGFTDIEQLLYDGRIFHFDSEGQIQWEIPEGSIETASGHLEDILIDGDRLVIASTIENLELLGLRPTIFAVENELLVWQFEVEIPFTSDQSFTNVIHSNDGNYIAGGLFHEVFEESDPDDGIDNYNAWLVKISPDGNYIWDRSFHFVESTDDEHSLIDMKLCPDGGVIFCGEAEDWSENANLPKQQGWIVKVNACGCLVPGCDPDCVVNTNDQTPVEIQPFLVGPNPMSQFLNVHVGSQDFRLNRQFQIHDLQGKLVDSFSARTGGTTYMYDVSELPTAFYVLSMIDEGHVVASQRVVIEH